VKNGGNYGIREETKEIKRREKILPAMLRGKK
jgi:hypothetical protein